MFADALLVFLSELGGPREIDARNDFSIVAILGYTSTQAALYEAQGIEAKGLSPCGECPYLLSELVDVV